jgi:hypothetical protein
MSLWNFIPIADFVSRCGPYEIVGSGSAYVNNAEGMMVAQRRVQVFGPQVGNITFVDVFSQRSEDNELAYACQTLNGRGFTVEVPDFCSLPADELVKSFLKNPELARVFRKNFRWSGADILRQAAFTLNAVNINVVKN